MKTREWALIISIIVLIQFIVQMAAWIYSGNQEILNYISFTGTIISIILAVLAIVYSYIQNLSQQTAASNISNQVDKLISIVNQVDMSKKFIGDSLEHLKNVSQKLDTTILHQSKISEQVETLSNKIGNTDFEKQLKLMGQDHINEPGGTDKNILAHGYNGTRFIAICLYFGEKRKFTLEQTYEKIIVPFSQRLDEDEDNNEHDQVFMKFQEGMFLGAWQSLAAFDLVKITNDKKGTFNLNENFRKECESIIDYALNDEDEDEDEDKNFLKHVVSIISELDKNNKKAKQNRDA